MPRFQFQLRTMFWLTAVAAVLCLLIPFLVSEYRERQRRLRIQAQREQTDRIFDVVPLPAGQRR